MASSTSELQPLTPPSTNILSSAVRVHPSYDATLNEHGGEADDLHSKRASSNNVSSLDFERIVNRNDARGIRRRFLSTGDANDSASGRNATRWVLTTVDGLLVGLTSIFLVTCTGYFVTWRAEILRDAVLDWETQSSGARFTNFAVFLSANVLLALLSSILCVAWVPSAAGSGIPEVKAYLNGVRSMRRLADLPLFFVKIMSTILSVTSGLSVGQEGPLIHIGAIVGSHCSKFGKSSADMLMRWRKNRRGNKGSENEPAWIGQLLDRSNDELSHFGSDAERRDFVSIGASVGFAASFGSPIGGLLFILDDVSSYFDRHLLLRMLVANAIGTFCLAVKHGDLSNYSIINLGDYETPDDNLFVNRVEETPLYCLIGLGGGVLGGFFCVGYQWLRENVTSKFPTTRSRRAKWQLAEVAIVSIITSIVLFYLPTIDWACKIVDEEHYEQEERKRFFCSPGEKNEMASILFGSRISAIKNILTDPSDYQNKTLVTVGVAFYTLTLITCGTSMANGIFTPIVLVGASLGGACGNLFHQYVDTLITPSTFAVLGVAASLAGVQHSTVSTAVILVEGTGQIKVLSPVIIVVVIARYVSQKIHEKGFFESAIEYKSLPYLEHDNVKPSYDAIQVKDIMSKAPLQTLGSQEQVVDVVKLLQDSKHHGFPVLENGRYVGMIRRAQIAALIERGLFTKERVVRREEVNKSLHWHTESSNVTPIQDQTACSLSRDIQGKLIVSWVRPEFEGHWLDLASEANMGSCIVTEFCPVSKAYVIFTSMGLRHMIVFGGATGGEVVGILTRANFLQTHIEARLEELGCNEED